MRTRRDFLKNLGAGVVFLAILPSAADAAVGNAKAADPWRIPSDKGKFHIFLLMGQSNMSGYGRLLPADRTPVPRVVELPTRYKGELKWGPAAHPLHNRLKSDRFGLGLSFAAEYLKDKPGVVVGLIPVARGGAAIDRLKKGTGVYSDAMKKAAFAVQQGTIKGVLWHQGESDTVREAAAASYEKKLHQLIADLRKDLKDAELPFIVGNLAEFYGTSREHNQPDRVKRIDKVRGILRALPSRIKHTGFVESKGCSSPDKHMVHFDRKSYILLGRRYARVYKAVMDIGKPDASEQKIEFDLTQLDKNGLRGPANGKVSVSYEFAIPNTDKHKAAVKAIDRTVKFMPGSRGRIRAGRNQCLCVGSTHQKNYKQVLRQLASLPYIARIIECHFE